MTPSGSRCSWSWFRTCSSCDVGGGGECTAGNVGSARLGASSAPYAPVVVGTAAAPPGPPPSCRLCRLSLSGRSVRAAGAAVCMAASAAAYSDDAETIWLEYVSSWRSYAAWRALADGSM